MFPASTSGMSSSCSQVSRLNAAMFSLFGMNPQLENVETVVNTAKVHTLRALLRSVRLAPVDV